MANGDLLTANYQFQLHNTLYGTGNGGVSLDNGKSIDGLGVPDTKTQDVKWNLRDGSYANPDYLDVRLITIPVMLRIGSGTLATMMTNFKALTLDWTPEVIDTDLAFQLPGWNKFMVTGRPRGAKADTSLLNRGLVRVLLRFDCPTPTITYL